MRRAVEFCRRQGIEILTLYAFSTENWQRPRSEISGLMELLSQYLDSELEELHANDIRVRTIGDLSRMPPLLAAKIEAAKTKTETNESMILNVALSYGGRQDIVVAALKLAEAMKSGALNRDEVTEEVFSAFLQTAGMRDPDLLIRTGGEIRISNFLLWQSAYTELYFTDVLWPDFDDEVFGAAVAAYQSRQRRYGMTSEQLETDERSS